MDGWQCLEQVLEAVLGSGRGCHSGKHSGCSLGRENGHGGNAYARGDGSSHCGRGRGRDVCVSPPFRNRESQERGRMWVLG